MLPRTVGAIGHHRITDLRTVLNAGDLLVLNDSRVLPARVVGMRPSGGRLEVLFVRPAEPEGGTWETIVRGTPRVGERVALPQAVGRWEAQRGGGRWALMLEGVPSVHEWLGRVGQLPLPPYIRRPDGPTALDHERYQTVIAARPGAVAAPTAGLHFTAALLRDLGRRGVPHVTVTLHVGPGTFLPIRGETIADMVVEPEWCEVSEAAAAAIEATRARGGRVVAVGTTTCRALESVAAEAGYVVPGARWACATIRPGHRFRTVDSLLTNFHLPRTTLLALVAAFVGWGRLRHAYEEAVRERYRFYSYGDAMLVS